MRQDTPATMRRLRSNRERKKKVYPWILGVAVLLVIVFFFKLLQPILTPFVTAAILAYILDPMVSKISGKHVRRGIASMLVMILTLTLIIVMLLIIIPMIISQFQNLMDKLPEFYNWVNTRALPWINSTMGVKIELDHALFNSLWGEYSGSIRNALSKLTPWLAKSGGSVIGIASNVMLLPFLLYYFLLDWPKWSEGFKELIPKRFYSNSTRIMGELDEVLGEFMRGQLMVMIIMGLVYGLGLKLVNLDNGFAIGMVAGLLVFIPYLGAFTGLLLATIAALLQYDSVMGLFMVWGVFIVGQTLESFIVTPYLVGERIGLSPLAVIFALMAFGHLMGFVGMLLALPLAAISLVFFREIRKVYLRSRLYNG